MIARLIRACLLIGLAFSTLSGDTVVLEADRDNTILDDPNNPLSGGKTRRLIIGRTNTAGLRRRALVHFDLSAIPAGSTVTSARLTMRLAQVRIPFDPIQVGLHRVLQDWGEGDSIATSQFGRGAPAASGDATWDHTFFDNQFWDSAGGDFQASAAATTTVEGQGFYSWESPQLGADVQSWLDQPSQNFGWLVRGGESESGTGRGFDSREATSANARPRLEVDFTPPPAPGNFSFSAPALDINEGDGTISVSVIRTAGTQGAVTVSISATNGTALAGADFEAVSGILNFADGQSEASFDLEVLDDDVPEPVKTFTISLSDPTGGTGLGAPTQIVVTLADNDFIELFFAQFGNGAGLIFSQINLVNPDPEASAEVTVILRDGNGQPLNLPLNGENTTDGALSLVIPPRGARTLQSDGDGDLQVGSALVRSNLALTGVILFGGATGLAGVNASPAFDEGFFVPAEVSTERNINTGVAMMNLEDGELTIQVELIDAQGTTVATTEEILAPRGQLARFATELFESSPQPVDFSDFQGTLRVTAAGKIAATALQTRPNQLATLPATAN